MLSLAPWQRFWNALVGTIFLMSAIVLNVLSAHYAWGLFLGTVGCMLLLFAMLARSRRSRTRSERRSRSKTS